MTGEITGAGREPRVINLLSGQAVKVLSKCLYLQICIYLNFGPYVSVLTPMDGPTCMCMQIALILFKGCSKKIKNKEMKQREIQNRGIQRELEENGPEQMQSDTKMYEKFEVQIELLLIERIRKLSSLLQHLVIKLSPLLLINQKQKLHVHYNKYFSVHAKLQDYCC